MQDGFKCGACGYFSFEAKLECPRCGWLLEEKQLVGGKLLNKSTSDELRIQKESEMKSYMADLVNDLTILAEKKVDYVNIDTKLRTKVDTQIKRLFKMDLSVWTDEDKAFYLKYKDYPGRNEYIKIRSEHNISRETISKKLDGIAKLLSLIAELQGGNSRLQGEILKNAKNSGKLNAMALVHDVFGD